MQLERFHFDSLDSTNSWAIRHAAELPHDRMSLITADSQTAGRGRFKRPWQSPAGQNIYATFCWFEPQYTTQMANLPQLLAVTVAQLLDAFGFQLQLKWPNDLLLSHKKVGGILCETTKVSEGILVILGLGINVNMPQELLQQVNQPATSLQVERDKPWDRTVLINKLQQDFLSNWVRFQREGFAPFLHEYRKRILGIGQRIEVQDVQGVSAGVFESIADDGGLILRLDSGQKRRVYAGEINVSSL